MGRIRLSHLMFAAAVMVCGALWADRNYRDRHLTPVDAAIRDHAAKLVRDGREIFRFDTFGSEAFWGGALRLHETVARLTPRAALGLGLKVDSEMLPRDMVEAVRRGAVNLDDPATTAALLQLDAVVGVKGVFGGDGRLTSIGIRCALCHSTVDQSFSTAAIPPGLIGRRLDGWPARDLNVGAIIGRRFNGEAFRRSARRPTRPPSAKCSRAGAPGSSTPN